MRTDKKLIKQTRIEDPEDLNNSVFTNDDDDSLFQFNVVYSEKIVDIVRPFDYSLRGFGFLMNARNDVKRTDIIDPIQNYPEIVAVERGYTDLFSK